ncbi:MAG: LpqB family beta-propeller domain-containing protein [Nocardioides sp.]|uniref:LpqB family beta-propeller domain-containing protein n=1 Tax=Nocardioides sp. TaxID=35761 RepID=UPI0039E3FE57
MRRPRSRPRPTLLRVLAPMVCAGAALVALTGCLSVPTSGPVRELSVQPTQVSSEAIPYSPRAPQPGLTPGQVVRGFLDAMTASPLSTTVARQYLSRSFADSWDPDRRTILYDNTRPPLGGSSIVVDITGATWLDARGTWKGQLDKGRAALRFSLVRESGQWRISAAPNALVVPATWYQSRFTQRFVYYLDPSDRVLVPEPVFVPTGTQLATSLIRSLLLGPAAPARSVVHSFAPVGRREDASISVEDGLARISLAGSADYLTARTKRLLAAQLAWTLRQDRDVERMRLVIGGETVVFPGAGSTIPVSGSARYSPNGAGASDALYAVRTGVLERYADGAGFDVVSGRWASVHDLVTAAVDAHDRQVAAVTSDRRSVLVGPLSGSAKVTRLPLRGTDLLQPAWDLSGRLWLVDRTADGAVVSYVRDGRVHRVRIRGVTGANVRRFLVSRDGTRFVAVIRHEVGDRMVVSRIGADSDGRVESASPAVELAYPSSRRARLRDIGWRSPTTVYAVQWTSGTALVNVVSLDGATLDVSGDEFPVGSTPRALVSSPVDGTPLYARTGRKLSDLSGNADLRLPSGVSSAFYAG